MLLDEYARKGDGQESMTLQISQAGPTPADDLHGGSDLPRVALRVLGRVEEQPDHGGRKSGASDSPRLE
jgi:hypothetical protein